MRRALTLERLNAADARRTSSPCSTASTSTRPGSPSGAWPRGPFATPRAAQARAGRGRAPRPAATSSSPCCARTPSSPARRWSPRRMTAESTHEQGRAGLTALHGRRVRADRSASTPPTTRSSASRSCWRCAARAATGLTKAQIIATFERRLENHPDFEFAEALRNVHRVAELRLDDRFGVEPSSASRPGTAPSCWRATPTRATPRTASSPSPTSPTRTAPAAAQLVRWMRECGFDEVSIDAVGNVVGVYRAAATRDAKRLLTGSHYDTVRNGGKYDGRLGIFVPMVCVRELHRAGRRLPFALEVVGFAEEEGQRYKATFLGSGALVGQFDPALARPGRRRRRHDARGDAPRRPAGDAGGDRQAEARPRATTSASSRSTSSRARCSTSSACRSASSPRSTAACASPARCAAWRATPARRRWTTPARRRRRGRRARPLPREARRRSSRTWSARWACSRCRTARPTSCPAAASFSLDIRATTDPVRDACVADVLAELRRDLRAARPVAAALEETMRAAAAPCGARMAGALGARGRRRRPAGAPHAERRRPRRDEAGRGDAAGDAVRARRERRHQPQPARDRRTADDMQLAVEAFAHLLDELAATAHETTAMTRLRQARRLDRRALRRGSARSCRRWCACRPTRRRATTRRTPSAPPSCSQASASTPNAPGARRRGARARPGVDHQPDRAPPLRRRADDRPQRARRRRAAGRRLDATIPTAARSTTASSTAAPRR